MLPALALGHGDEMPQHVVADVVAVGVVDALEVIDVEVDQRQPPAQPPAPLHLAVEERRERAPVEAPRQGIALGGAAFALADPCERRGKTGGGEHGDDEEQPEEDSQLPEAREQREPACRQRAGCDVQRLHAQVHPFENQHGEDTDEHGDQRHRAGKMEDVAWWSAQQAVNPAAHRVAQVMKHRNQRDHLEHVTHDPSAPDPLGLE